jgi:hypothetical protein
MGLAQTQQVLAQLYTNTELRERFSANPQVVGAELGLSLEEAQQLAKLSVREVNVFANSLKWKRLGEVRELLPRTAKVLGKNFTTLFWRYADTYLPTGIKKHRQDAIAFANFIIKVVPAENIELAWVSDLVRYEKTWLLAYQNHSRLNVRWFRYPIDKLASPEALHGVMMQPTIAVWWRLSVRASLQHFIISLPAF